MLFILLCRSLSTVSDKPLGKISTSTFKMSKPSLKLLGVAVSHQEFNVSSRWKKKHFGLSLTRFSFSFLFFSPGLPSDTNVVTPNTECSWDFTTKTRSTNDDVTSLDLEWEDEEGETPCLSVTAVLIFPCTPSLLTEFQHKSLDLQESIGLFQSGRDLGQKRTSCVRRCGPVANT